MISKGLILRWTTERRWRLKGFYQQRTEAERRQWERLTSLKDRNLLSVFSRCSSTHSFLLCSSSFLFSRFCRRQRETVRAFRGRKNRVPFHLRLLSMPQHLVTVVTYQVDLMMLVEDYGALLGSQLLLLLGLHALILKNTQTLILMDSKLHLDHKLCTWWVQLLLLR